MFKPIREASPSRLLLLLALVTSMAVSASTPLGISPPRRADIDPLVLAELKRDGQADIFVKLTDDADLSALEAISDRVERLRTAHALLTAHADQSQADLRALLDEREVQFTVFWINNSLFIRAANTALVQALASHPDVAYIRGNHRVPLINPVAQSPDGGAVNAVEWGVQKINADDVWSQGHTGSGIVVANIDTGVRHTHEALVGQYRGNLGGGSFDHDYNWWDPDLVAPAPADPAAHGTHTMGTMVGGDGPGAFVNDIGVAPAAEWIAAQGCGLIFCSDFDLISSAQWIACPTRVDGSDPDCSKAPHIVNNSWGGGGGNPWYTSYVNSWLAAGIVPVFSAGNSGPECSTMGSPGDYRFVIAVGATDINDVLASFSSKGPGAFRLLKPDFVAPGEDVRSSVSSGDSAYAVFSGTSMAAPHLSGTLALLLSADPSASILDLYAALFDTTSQSLGAPPGPTECRGRSYDVYPNAIYGWGRIDAAAALADLLP